MARIEMTEEQMNSMIEASAKAGAMAALASMQPASPIAVVPATPDQEFDAVMRGRRGLDNPPIPVELVEGCKSHVSGATFTAKIVHGVVTDLIDYKYPDGYEKHISEGGLVTDGLQISDKNGQHTAVYKQWLWETHYQLDIRTYVKRPLPKYARPEPEAK